MTDVDAHLRLARSLLCAELPYLAGLAHAAEYFVSEAIGTAGASADGRIVVNPRWFTALHATDAMFVLAHELLHIALRHGDRFASHPDPLAANLACDAVINDLLCHQLDLHAPPADGIHVPGARRKAAESILLAAGSNRGRSWRPDPYGSHEHRGDLLDQATADRLLGPSARGPLEIRELEQVAANALATMAIGDAPTLRVRGESVEHNRETLTALQARYRPPWQQALSAWLEATTTQRRTYARASRRSPSSPDIVLPGRERQGFIVRIVLDTSGSMSSALAMCLGLIAEFCSGHDAVARVVQCDTEVTSDDIVTPEELAKFRISGYGGSDMTPGLERLAQDQAAEAVVVITDGCIGYPRVPPPFPVLWALTDDYDFRPGYGSVVRIVE